MIYKDSLNIECPTVADKIKVLCCHGNQIQLATKKIIPCVISKLCAATDSDERLFWKLLKGQCCSSQMSAFLVYGKMITDKWEYVIFGQTILRHLVPSWQDTV